MPHNLHLPTQTLSALLLLALLPVFTPPASALSAPAPIPDASPSASAPVPDASPSASTYPRLLTVPELLSAPHLLAGIYAAYPADEPPSLTPSPAGYEPCYISHYGRHGSRFQPNDSRYLNTLHRLQQAQRDGNLTPFGQSLLPRIQRLCDYACGHGGQLTSLGVKQHQAIARRLYERFPEVFACQRPVQAVSSISGRCIASMQAFTQALQACDSTLSIHCSSDTAAMAYISYDTPAQYALTHDTTLPWYRDYAHYALSHLPLGRLMDTLFVSPAGLDSLHTFADLYWLCAGMQDLELDVDLSDVFTPQELLAAYRCVNYRMYVCNALCPLSHGLPLQSASSLLRRLLDDADHALSAPVLDASPSAAHLRFGHDSNLLRLLALMSVHNAANQQPDTACFWQSWQECTLSPMAANLQLVFYRPSRPEASSGASPLLVKLLLNEHEVLLDAPLRPLTGPYYAWPALRDFLEARLAAFAVPVPDASPSAQPLPLEIPVQ